jgi:hypothetical protein
VLRSRVGLRLPAAALPIEDISGPARKHLRASPLGWWWYVLIAAVACVIAWVAGGR